MLGVSPSSLAFSDVWCFGEWNTVLSGESYDLSTQRIIQATEYLGLDLGWHSAVVRFSHGSSNACKAVDITTKRDGVAHSILEVGRLEKCHCSGGHCTLTSYIEATSALQNVQPHGAIVAEAVV
jgi:hydroxymethylpyrimidine/phosphomethylpyrimidine kinase